LKIRADLLAPPNEIKPQDILDTDSKAVDAFCSAEEAKKEKDERLKAFQDNQGDHFSFHHTMHTFPVFDANYHKAVVIVTGSAIGGSRDTSRLNCVYSIYLLVYLKINGSWHHVATKILTIT
jgi:hypothetical protein